MLPGLAFFIAVCGALVSLKLSPGSGVRRVIYEPTSDEAQEQLLLADGRGDALLDGALEKHFSDRRNKWRRGIGGGRDVTAVLSSDAGWVARGGYLPGCASIGRWREMKCEGGWRAVTRHGRRLGARAELRGNRAARTRRHRVRLAMRDDDATLCKDVMARDWLRWLAGWLRSGVCELAGGSWGTASLVAWT